MDHKKIKMMCEAAMLLALAQILGYLRIYEFPNGGSVDAATLPIFRPVIAMDKEEIIRISRRIGTFETSILPFEDCCTVFTPRHPRLRPLPGEVEAAEANLDIEAMVKDAVDNIERVWV